MKVAGLSIEDGRARAAIIAGKFKTFKVLNTEDFELPPELGARQKALRDALAGWKEEFDIRGVVLGLNFRDFSHHFIDLPTSEHHEIDRALGFELEKHLPLSPEEYRFDFHTVETGINGSTNLVLAIRKDKLKWISGCLADTGLKLLGLRCTGLEVLNHFISLETPHDVLFIYREGGSHWVLGLRDSEPTAMKVLTRGADVAAEVRNLSATYEKGIYMSDAEDIPGLSMNIHKMSFAATVLLAASATARRPIEMDFMPDELRPKKADYFPHVAVSLAAAMVIFFFMTTLLAYYKDYSTLGKVRDRINEIKQSAHELVEKRREMEEIDRRTAFLLKFQSDRNALIRVVRNLSTILPKNAWLTGMTAEKDGKIEVEGIAKSSARIIGALQTSGFFNSVEFSSPVNIRNGEEHFSVEMVMQK